MNNLTIDNPKEPEEYHQAVEAFMMVVAENPNQEVGDAAGIPQLINDKTFVVIRNEDSYTVRVGAEAENEGDIMPPPMLEGFPV